MSNIFKYRFPGLNSYTKNDEPIFKGRNDESLKLFTKVTLYKTLVLHADSGTGKSSLIQAGLLPLIDKSEEKYAPVIIKMNEIVSDDSDSLLVDYTIAKIKDEYSDNLNITLHLIEDTPLSLWKISKQLEKEGKKLLLIFDQFENLQSFKIKQINYLIAELFDLLNSKIPQNLYGSIEEKISSKIDTESNEYKEINRSYQFLSHPSIAKALFVIREDKLGVMSLLSDYFPDILKNDFVIKSLSKKSAFEALVEPARANGEYKSLPFKYENDEIVYDLINEIADNETNLIDPIQLQIVASNIERNVVIKREKATITSKDIPKIGDIIIEYYNICWDDVKKNLRFTEQQIYEFRKQIISQLVVNERRDLVYSDRIVTSLGVEKVLKELVKIGFIREIPYEKNTFYYQLCHDRLIAPITKDIFSFKAKDKADQLAKQEKKKLEEEKRKASELAKQEIQKLEHLIALDEQKLKVELEKHKRKFILKIFSFFIAVVLIAGPIYYYKQQTETTELKQSNILSKLTLLRKSNPTFSYVVARQWMVHNHFNQKFKDFISYYDSSKYALLKGVYPFSSSIIDVNIQSTNILIITDKYSITTWDTKTNLIVNQKRLTKGYYIGKKKIKGVDNYLVINGDSLEIQKSNGEIVGKIPNTARTENIDISSDGKYCVIDRTVYNLSKPNKSIGDLPEFSGVNDHELMATVFLNDSKHIAAGYWSGYKLIFRIDENHKKKIRVTAIFPLVGGHSNYVITCLAVDSKDKYLYAGSRQKTIEVWKLDGLDCTDGACNKELTASNYFKITGEDLFKAQPARVLNGHNDCVNSISVSPNDGVLLSGSDDNTGILWDCQSGKKLSVIKGRQSEVKYSAFLGDDKNLYTATDDELLFIWSRDKASKLYDAGQLAKFSPFDYYTAGLGKDDEYKGAIYDTLKTSNLFSNTLHYIISMPPNNQDPENIDYLINLTRSLNEIDLMYRSLMKREDYKNTISNDNKKLLYKHYNILKFSTPDLLLKTENETKKAKIERSGQYYLNRMKDLFVDTSKVDIGVAISTAKKLQIVCRYYRDSLKSYDTATYYSENALRLIEVFYTKFNDDKDLRKELGSYYAKLSYNYLFVKKYKEAINYSKKGIALDAKNNDWINMPLALGYLLNKQFKEAEDIYFTLKDKDYDKTESFKDGFLDSFDALEKAGVINKNNIEIYNEVTKIKSELLKVKSKSH